MTKNYSIRKASELLGVNRRTLYNWIKKGSIEYTLVNGSFCIDENQITYLIKKLGYGKKTND